MSLWDTYDWIKDGLSDVIAFIGALTDLIISITCLITGVFLDLFNTNVYASTFFAVVLIGISLVVFLRIWNIMADIQIFGWKLPKL